jgi:hypothetical protein
VDQKKYYTSLVLGFIKKHFFCFSLILGLSVWSLWPIIKDPSRRTADPWDGVLMAWYLNQTIEKIPGNLNQIFQGNIFYPYKNTMAYSDMHILSAIVSYIPVKTLHEPIVAVSVSLLFGQVATIFILYLWFYEITKSKTASFLAAVGLGFSATRMGFIVHLQMWNLEWFLLSSYLFYLFFTRKKNLFAYLSLIILGLQMWESPLGVYFGLLMIFLISVFNIRYLKKNLKALILPFLLFLLIILLPASAYVSVSKEFNYTRSIRDAAHFSTGVDEIIKGVILKPIFAAFLLSLYFLRRGVKKINLNTWALTLSLSSLILTLGPVLKWAGKTVKIFGRVPVPLPYSILYYLVPGFNAFRTPARWVWIFILGMSFIVAMGLAKFLRDKKVALGWKISVVILLFVLSLSDAKVKNYYVFQKVSEYPEVYKALRNNPPGVILELPVYGWASGEIAAIETHRMVYSLYSQKYMLGGFSGFNPPSWDRMISNSWNQFPSPEFDKKLINTEVDYILVWKNLYSKEKLADIQKWGKGFTIYEDEGYLLLDFSKDKID